jgi:hypothetical protein
MNEIIVGAINSFCVPVALCTRRDNQKIIRKSYVPLAKTEDAGGRGRWSLALPSAHIPHLPRAAGGPIS